ncbi:MAG: hypothetical protein ABI267_01175 [Ginsengibacter sp.]
MNTLDFTKKLKLFSALFVCLLSGISLFAQTNSVDRMVSSFENYTQNHLQEKVYLHTDRSYYLCGEILWFKAYLEDAKNNKPLSLSKVVYVELLNKSHDPVLQTKIGIKDGNGNGSFSLPLSLETGNYELRAYTNWMKNDSVSHFFRKMITVVNTTQNLDTTMVHSHYKYSAEFFPEGGNLVTGLKSLVAFKINDNYGNGVVGSGVIIDQSNDTIAHFQTAHSGMGNFLFTPETGKNYHAVISITGDSSITENLPNAYSGGYIMHLDDEGNSIKITVNSSNQNSSGIYLIGTTRQQIDFSKSSKIENGNASFSINKSDLKDGIAQITLFNENRRPVCERLYFKRPSKKLLIDAKADKQNYNKRNAVNIGLSTSDGSSNPLAGNLSVSVYRLDSLHQPENGNIFTYLWLSSDIKGYIENPDYYFENDNPETNKALDNLLLTQGWRTFDWNSLSSGSAASFAYMPENQGPIITGKITDEATGQPAANVLVYLSIPGRRVQLYGCMSNEEGLVHFNMENFYGASQIVLQTNTKEDSIYHLQIFSPFSEQYAVANIPVLTVSEENTDNLEASNLHMEIENAYHQNSLEKLQPLMIDTLPFYQKPFKTYLLDNYTRFTTMEEVMREYVAEVNVVKKQKHYHFNTFNERGFELENLQPSEKIMTKDPLVMLDGVPVFDIDKIIAYDPLKVQKLEVVASRYIWGPIQADGIVSFTTYKGDLPGYSLNPHDVILDYNGLQRQRIFYSPDYSTDKAMQSRLPDFRDVLYWSPNINTDAKGKGQISFYTGDIPGKYLVEVQGIAADGDAGSSSFIFDVEK